MLLLPLLQPGDAFSKGSRPRPKENLKLKFKNSSKNFFNFSLKLAALSLRGRASDGLSALGPAPIGAGAGSAPHALAARSAPLRGHSQWLLLKSTACAPHSQLWANLRTEGGRCGLRGGGREGGRWGGRGRGTEERSGGD